MSKWKESLIVIAILAGLAALHLGAWAFYYRYDCGKPKVKSSESAYAREGKPGVQSDVTTSTPYRDWMGRCFVTIRVDATILTEDGRTERTISIKTFRVKPEPMTLVEEQ
jgi:hypothetical protein